MLSPNPCFLAPSCFVAMEEGKRQTPSLFLLVLVFTKPGRATKLNSGSAL